MNKKIKTRLSLLLVVLALVILPSAIARFTAKKRFSGELNINNHPGGRKLRDVILEDNDGINAIKAKGIPDFSDISTTKEGIFMAEDDYGDSYYYRGVADNWVSFAGFYWRIIRINGDGSIRLIYSGTKTNNTGSGTQIWTSAYNSKQNEEKYADYKISTVKSGVEHWYKLNILDKGYDGKIADTGYCNDMTKKDERDFASWARLYQNKTPTLKCPDKAKDLLSKGNNKLIYPVGLLTQDEASFAGGVYYPLYNTKPYVNEKYYLYTENLYWTMTPANWNSSNVIIGNISEYGFLNNRDANYSEGGVRPVLSLKPNVLVASGDGKLESPYIIN